MEQSTPILLRKDIAIKLMAFFRSYIPNRFSRNAFVSPVPRMFGGGYLMLFVSKLFNDKTDEVGWFRVYIYVPEDENLNILIRIEWRRNIFGFWYRNDLWIKSNIDPVGEFHSNIKNMMKWVYMTADGTVRISSMNRLFKKIKVNPVKDKAIRNGLVMG
jgi:hypothetical protein